MVTGSPISNSLIIDLRRQLPWRRRIVSDASTAGLWGGWIWLCQPAMGMMSPARLAHLQDAMAQGLVDGVPGALARAALAVFGATGALWIWRRSRQRAPAAASVPATPDYATHFGVNELHLHRCRTSQVCVVHHDDAGRIVGIEAVAPVSQPAVVGGGEVTTLPVGEAAPAPAEIAEAA